MDIKPGNTYRTRNGNIAMVEAEHDGETLWKFSGKCLDKNGSFERIAYWTSNGIYNINHQSSFDIIN